MRFATARFRALGLAVTLLLALGWMTQRLLAPPSETSQEVGARGWRALLADYWWLQTYAAWERRDEAGLRQALQRTVWLDERPVWFWTQGAQMLAFDVPAWRLQEQSNPSAELVAKIEEEQARQALAWLEQGRRYHPEHPALWLEIAGIQWLRLHDAAGAAESYRRAAELPGAPWLAVRLHAELLRRDGRCREALAWLVRWHPHLPADAEGADATGVLARIRQLEAQLHVPAEATYRGR